MSPNYVHTAMPAHRVRTNVFVAGAHTKISDVMPLPQATGHSPQRPTQLSFRASRRLLMAQASLFCDICSRRIITRDTQQEIAVPEAQMPLTGAVGIRIKIVQCRCKQRFSWNKHVGRSLAGGRMSPDYLDALLHTHRPCWATGFGSVTFDGHALPLHQGRAASGPVVRHPSGPYHDEGPTHIPYARLQSTSVHFLDNPTAAE